MPLATLDMRDVRNVFIIRAYDIGYVSEVQYNKTREIKDVAHAKSNQMILSGDEIFQNGLHGICL